jgi:hypothetical protein
MRTVTGQQAVAAHCDPRLFERVLARTSGGGAAR